MNGKQNRLTNQCLLLKEYLFYDMVHETVVLDLMTLSPPPNTHIGISLGEANSGRLRMITVERQGSIASICASQI